MKYIPTMKEYEIPLTRDELAEIFRVSVRTIDRNVKQGLLQCTKLGNGTLRFYDYQIQAFLDKVNLNSDEHEKTQMAANNLSDEAKVLIYILFKIYNESKIMMDSFTFDVSWVLDRFNSKRDARKILEDLAWDEIIKIRVLDSTHGDMYSFEFTNKGFEYAEKIEQEIVQ